MKNRKFISTFSYLYFIVFISYQGYSQEIIITPKAVNTISTKTIIIEPGFRAPRGTAMSFKIDRSEWGCIPPTFTVIPIHFVDHISIELEIFDADSPFSIIITTDQDVIVSEIIDVDSYVLGPAIFTHDTSDYESGNYRVKVNADGNEMVRGIQKF